MIILVSLMLSVLLICDIILIAYCRVNRPFTVFTFSFLVVVLAVLMLMLTGDISIVYGG